MVLMVSVTFSVAMMVVFMMMSLLAMFGMGTVVVMVLLPMGPVSSTIINRGFICAGAR